MENKPSGSGFLKVCGILMIIGGAIALIVAIIAVAGLGLLQATLGAEFKVGLAWVAVILAFVGAVVELVTGIVGVVNSKKPEKAKVCIFWGCFVAVMSVASAILTTASGQDFPVMSLLLGLVLPVLFIIGAVKNMKS